MSINVNLQSPHASSIAYRPDIDGLRAIAVTAVVFNHVDLGCSGGYVGVDVFFVISGYLITSLILRDLDTGKFRAVEFWERRVRRIIPALFVSVLGVFAAAWMLYLPWDFARLGPAMMSQSVAASNIVHWSISGYFAPDAETLPLLHTWSLAVEEQFYLLLPVTLWLLHKWQKSWIKPMLIVGLLASFGVCVWMTKRSPSASFYLLPTRSWELLMGSLLAHGLSRKIVEVRWLREVLSLCGAAAIGWSIFRFDSTTPFPGTAALLPTLGTLAVIWSNEEAQTLVGRVLAWPPMVFIGKISYSLYLIHWPLIVFTRYRLMRELTTPEKGFVIAAAFIMATLSWAIVETPLRQKKLLGDRKPLFAVSAVALVLVTALGLWVYQAQGIPSRFTTEQLVYLNDPDLMKGFGRIDKNDVRSGKLKEFGADTGPIECVVWGDSHAQRLMSCIDEVCREKGIRGASAFHASTAPLLDFTFKNRYTVEDSKQYNDVIFKYAIDHRVRYVILAGFWSTYANTPGFQECFDKTVKSLTSAGIQVIVVRDVALQSGDVPRLLTRALIYGQDVSTIGIPLAQHRKHQAQADQTIDRLPKNQVTIIDPILQLVDDKGICRAEMNGVSLYQDQDHISYSGALRLKPLFEQALVK